jgi:hypothetical protein
MTPMLAVLWLIVMVGDAAATTAEAIPWHDARRYVGEERVVEGEVVAVRREGNVLRLVFDPDPNSFSVALIIGLLSPLPADPEAVYRGRTVRAYGRIRRFRGATEMVIRDPTRIILVEPTVDAARMPAVRIDQRLNELEERVERLEKLLQRPAQK